MKNPASRAILTVARSLGLAAILVTAVTAGVAPLADLVEAQKARIAAMKSAPKAKPHVAFVSNGVADFWTIAKAGAIAAGRELGCQVTVEFPGGGLGDQKRMLEDLVARGIDGISVSPIDPVNQSDVLSLVAEKSLLITNDSDAPKAPRLCYIGMDNYEAGLMCGKLAREGCAGGEVAIFIGRLEQDNAKRRRQGFIDGLLGRTPDAARYDEPGKPITEAGYTIVGTWTDSFDRAKAKANIEDVLIKHPKLALMTGLFEYNSSLAVEVLKQTGMQGKVMLAGFDEGADVIQGIKDGFVLGTVVQDPYGYGFESVRLLNAFCKGDMSMVPASGILSIPARVIRKDNAEGFWKELKARIKAGKEAPAK
ncbi:MAG: substrate-binding domain-containing protein [Planctomycetes bacterium]|nr:substrate-binding domain-containing protein [Planctomycetota bacterium]